MRVRRNSRTAAVDLPMMRAVAPPKVLTGRPKLIAPGPLACARGLVAPSPRAPFRVHLEVATAEASPERTAIAEPKRAHRAIQPESVEREEPARELDSAARTAALLAPPPHVAPAPPAAPPSPVSVSQQLAVELVEKAAFWGDGTRGVARLRFNGRARAGLANATITLEHDGDEMHLRVEGIDPETEEQLRERLAARGVTLSGET